MQTIKDTAKILNFRTVVDSSANCGWYEEYLTLSQTEIKLGDEVYVELRKDWAKEGKFWREHSGVVVEATEKAIKVRGEGEEDGEWIPLRGAWVWDLDQYQAEYGS